jgi:toxin YoeB
MNIVWHPGAWDEYLWWQENDRKQVRRINRLVRDIQRGDDAEGIGKPELLTGKLSGWASRRIDQEHRLVYRVKGENLEIVQCRFHYEK